MTTTRPVTTTLLKKKKMQQPVHHWQHSLRFQCAFAIQDNYHKDSLIFLEQRRQQEFSHRDKMFPPNLVQYTMNFCR